LTAFIALPITAYFLGYGTELIVISVLMTLLAFYMHRGNFQRIWSREEIRISDVLKKKKTSQMIDVEE
jgi:glycerol-3-phosphate acyltransferase PlsY